MKLNSDTWRKSTYSGGNGGGCVEVGTAGDVIAVRDTTNRDGGTLAFSAQAWKAFAMKIKHDSEVV
jgi:hypothetical protein